LRECKEPTHLEEGKVRREARYSMNLRIRKGGREGGREEGREGKVVSTGN